VVLVAGARRGMTAFGRLVRRFRTPLLAVAAVGTALGVAGYLVGPAVSSLAGAVAVFVTAMVAGATLRLRRLLRDIGRGEWGASGAP
jgi:hypothetical protein